MNAYNTPNEITFTPNELVGYGEPIETREFTQDEISFSKLVNGKVGVDQTKKSAYEATQKTAEIARVKAMIISALDSTEKKISGDPSHPSDVPLWVAYRAGLRGEMAALNTLTLDQLKSYSIQSVRPF